MKFVKKGREPQKYRDWCSTVKGTGKEDYRELKLDVKSVLHSALLENQGRICAYTMKRIDKDNSHIEHIKPEGLCRNEMRGSDLYFSNLVACFPRAGMPSSCRYGAQKKDNWWEPNSFVSPLHVSCEKKFRFKRNGEIKALGSNSAASNTIKILALDNPTLTEDRRRAMNELIFGRNGDEPLSSAKARRLKDSVCTRSGTGFAEFCVALKDALDEHISYVEKAARKRNYARKGRK